MFGNSYVSQIAVEVWRGSPLICTSIKLGELNDAHKKRLQQEWSLVYVCIWIWYILTCAHTQNILIWTLLHITTSGQKLHNELWDLIYRCVSLQIMSNQIYLPQMDSYQDVETSQRWLKEIGGTRAKVQVSKQRVWIQCDTSVFPF